MPEFLFKNHTKLPSIRSTAGATIAASQMGGEPLLNSEIIATSDGLTSVTRAIKELKEDGVLQIFLTPKNPSFWKKRSVTSQYERELTATQLGVTTSTQGLFGSATKQESLTVIDQSALVKSERIGRELKRVLAETACEVQITAAFRHRDKKLAQSSARQMLQILGGSMKSADPEKRFHIRDCSNPLGLFHFGHPSGSSTLLTTDESTLFSILPLCDLGLSVVERAGFHTNPGNKDGLTKTNREQIEGYGVTTNTSQSDDSRIVIGKIIGEGRKIAGELSVDKNIFAEHGGIYGNTGSGKTTTVKSIVYQLYKKGVNPLILVPGKATDWYDLLDIIPDLRVFTAGDETTAPFRFNPLLPAEGVLLNSHISGITDCFLAAWPTEGMVKEQVENVFNEVYDGSGWNRRKNIRGKNILVPDLLGAVHNVELAYLHYSDRMNQDFSGALRARFSTFLRDPLLPIFNCWPGMTVKEILSKPTIIEMRGLSAEQKALLTSLLTTSIALYLEARVTSSGKPEQDLKHILVIEEAHHLLKKPSAGLGLHEGHSASQQAIKSLLTMFRESRSSGLGILLLDQLPGSMTPEAVKLPGSTIIHYLKDPAERMLVGLQANCTEDQIRQIGTMTRGEVVIHVTRTNQPVNVFVTSVERLVKKKTRTDWTNSRVAKHMEKVYTENPHFREWVEIQGGDFPSLLSTSRSRSKLVLPEQHALDSNMVAELLYVTDDPLFERGYSTAVSEAIVGRPLIAALIIKRLVLKLVNDIKLIGEYCEYLVWYLREKSSKSDWQSAHEQILNSLRNQVAALEGV
jgi:hypothetical protein